MLRGRESLARLVGKRRRNLPRDALLLRVSHSGRPGGPAADKGSPLPDPGIYGSPGMRREWVECPVCGRPIRGDDDYMINSHLDTCLTRGKKRKLTQRTLLQLNFCAKLGSRGVSGDPLIQQESTLEMLDDDCSDYGILECDDALAPIPGLSSTADCNNQALLDADNKDIDCDMEDSTIVSIPLSDNTFSEPCNFDLLVTLSSLVLETFIVGHKFHNEVNLSPGAEVIVMRDYENEKDKHALKVFCIDSGAEVMVGYLPRELAKCLSAFVDKFRLQLKGSVTSNFDDPAIIPIRLFCREIEETNDLLASDLLHWKKLWKEVLRVVDYEKMHPPTMMKYQKNFHIMVQEVLKHHAHVLEASEKELLWNFKLLSDDSQRIFIRLYTRKGPWFRISNISYREVKDIQMAIKELQLAGYVCHFLVDAQPSKSDIAEILDIFTIAELRNILNTVIPSKKCASGAKKDQLICELLTTYEEGKCSSLPDVILELAGACVKVSLTTESILWRIQRLFFLNGEQDFSSFLLVDLGLVKYPAYTCTISRHIFQDRDSLLAYEEAIAIAQLMDESIDDNDSKLIMSCTYFSYEQLSGGLEGSSFYSRFSALWVYSKVVMLGISFCERDRRYEDAVMLLKGLLEKVSCGRRGYWYLRLSVDLEHMGRINESLSTAEEGVLDPWVRAGSRIALQRRVMRLGKPPRRWKLPSYAASLSKKIKEVCIQGRPLNCETGSKNHYYGYDGMRCNVEQLALQYYEEDGGWNGVHTESGIWLTIFGLLMWDVIFSDIPDVFQTKFQTAPLDLDLDSFYQARKDLIESHLEKIQAGMAEEILITSWDRHFGTACRGVNWDHHSLSDLRAAVSCTGGHCLAYLLRHLAQDYRSWSSGMPDLFLWRFHGGELDGGEAKLVEVKGPRDRLSEQQRAWLLFLMDCGFDAEVCRVSEKPPEP